LTYSSAKVLAINAAFSRPSELKVAEMMKE